MSSEKLPSNQRREMRKNINEMGRELVTRAAASDIFEAFHTMVKAEIAFRSGTDFVSDQEKRRAERLKDKITTASRDQFVNAIAKLVELDRR